MTLDERTQQGRLWTADGKDAKCIPNQGREMDGNVWPGLATVDVEKGGVVESPEQPQQQQDGASAPSSPGTEPADLPRGRAPGVDDSLRRVVRHVLLRLDQHGGLCSRHTTRAGRWRPTARAPSAGS